MKNTDHTELINMPIKQKNLSNLTFQSRQTDDLQKWTKTVTCYRVKIEKAINREPKKNNENSSVIN